MPDAPSQFRDAIQAAGLTPPGVIEADGKLRRFASNGQRSDDAGWYVLHDDGLPAGSFGCWRSGVQLTWCAKSDTELSASEREAMRDRTEAMKLQREAELTQRHAEARDIAAQKLKQSRPVTQHPYLTAKGIQPHGVLVLGDKLVIPMRDTASVLHSLQFIGSDGCKRFLTGGRVAGCYFGIGKPDGALCIAEGYATGASIHESTGYAVAVAFNAGNLLAVAKALRAKYPDLRITICADADEVGKLKGFSAALASRSGFIFPEFDPDKFAAFIAKYGKPPTDYNDLIQIGGAV